MEELVKVAVAGCGYWGPNLIRNFRSIPECNVKIVCDLDQGRLVHIKGLYPEVEVTDDFNDLINDKEIDAIAIATPVWTHFDLAKNGLLVGKHIFIEKPMASTVSQCKELIEIAENMKSTLMVGHTFLYSAPVRKIKEIVDSGEIGELLYISSQRLNLGLFQKDINVTWGLAPHDISIILYIMGMAPDSVNCQGKAHVSPGIEDVTNMTLDFPNGGLATVHSSWLDPNKVRRMTFVGSKKMILYDDNEPLEKIKIYDKRVEVPPHYDTFAEFHYSYHYGDVYSPHLNQVEPLKVQCQHFLDCIRDGSKPQSSGAEGLEVIEILEAGLKSLKKGGARIEINGSEELEEEPLIEEVEQELTSDTAHSTV
jgi:predicted dehydrogenase